MGGLAKIIQRPLSMRELLGSIPGFSTERLIFTKHFKEGFVYGKQIKGRVSQFNVRVPFFSFARSFNSLCNKPVIKMLQKLMLLRLVTYLTK